MGDEYNKTFKSILDCEPYDNWIVCKKECIECKSVWIFGLGIKKKLLKVVWAEKVNLLGN